MGATWVQVPAEVRRGRWIPRLEVEAALSCQTWMLGDILGFPERSARAPNHWAASPTRNNLRYVWFRDRSGCHVSVFGWQWLLGACGKPLPPSNSSIKVSVLSKTIEGKSPAMAIGGEMRTWEPFLHTWSIPEKDCEEHCNYWRLQKSLSTNAKQSNWVCMDGSVMFSPSEHWWRKALCFPFTEERKTFLYKSCLQS